MILNHLNGRIALTIRLVGLGLISWTVLTASHHPPGGSGRGLVISVMLALCVVAWLMWTIDPASDRGITPELWVLAAAGGVLCGASPNSAASAFVFVAVVAAGVRAELPRAFIVVGVGSLTLAVSALLYDGRDSGCSPMRSVSRRRRWAARTPVWRNRHGSRGTSTICSLTRSPA